jgi:hypothetical protein
MKKIVEGDIYNQDFLYTTNNHEFMNDPAFQSAYARSVRAARQDFRIHWRIHTILWATHAAMQLDGDFVECGVGWGIMSSAVMTYTDWDNTGRKFYLLDTFSGVDSRYVAPLEIAFGALDNHESYVQSGIYPPSADVVIENFSEWKNIEIIVGPVPETLDQIKAERIAYLHIDMNCSPPEVAAVDYLWDRLVPGALIVLDDYAFVGFRQQKLAMDALAESKGVKVFSLPTGQGLIIRPPKS